MRAMPCANPCEKCREAEGRTTGIMYDGAVIATGFLCDPCFAIVLVRAARFRDELDALVAGGVSRDHALAIVRSRITGNVPTA